MVDFNKKISSSSGNINYELLEVFSQKISKPLVNLSMEGFTVSKMPDDYLISSLSKEIADSAQRMARVVDKNKDNRLISLYCVNLDYDKFKKDKTIEVSYSKFQEENFDFFLTPFASGSMRDCYLIRKNL
jgi:hypothetical protein